MKRNWSNLSWRRLLDESPIVSCDVAMVAVLLQHVDLQLYLLLLILSHIHHWGLKVEFFEGLKVEFFEEMTYNVMISSRPANL